MFVSVCVLSPLADFLRCSLIHELWNNHLLEKDIEADVRGEIPALV